MRGDVVGGAMKAARCGAMLLPPKSEGAARARRELSLPNPAHVAWLRHGKGREPDRALSACGVMDGGPWRGGVWAPREAPGWTGGADRTVMPEAEPLTFLWTLRDYQAPAVDAVVAAGGGGIIAPCGAGKTAMGCALMARWDTPTLVLVHTRDLAAQWVDRVRDSLGVEAEVVGYGKRSTGEHGRVVVASLQTLARWGWWKVHQWGQRFGLVVADEAHHVPAATWGAVVAGLAARHRVWLSATPDRPDGLGPILRWHMGPAVVEIDPKRIEAAGKVLAPVVRMWSAPHVDLEGMESHERARALADDVARNGGLVTEARLLVAQGRRVLLLTKLVDHCGELARMLCDAGVDAVALTGQTPKRERAETIERMRAGAVEVVCATSLADEGLDAPRLDACILAAPEGNVDRVEQRIGRVCRPHPDGMPPLVIDVVDGWGPFQGYARRRRRLYESRGWL
jgi:superfamily II DNA or RNA helicase